ncbi:hypothetical protein, partial [Paraburkholderia hospita]|uniref:hypothetical protein n=1 Tax=Paraburkholderia hospita TaxID=169430 RepID=UPI0013FDA799
MWHEAANALEQRASRIAQLEHTAVNAKPVGYFLNVNQPGMKVRYSQISGSSGIARTCLPSSPLSLTARWRRMGSGIGARG